MSIADLIGPDFTLDVVKLKDADPREVSKYMMANFMELVNRINATARVELKKGEVPGFEPSFGNDPAFLMKKHDSWYKAIWSRVRNENSFDSVQRLIFPVAVYLQQCYGTSCSKVIFGCEAPTAVPLWLQNWLAQAERLSSQDYSQLYSILESATPVTPDVLYIMKSRIQELAAQHGVPLEDYCRYPGQVDRDVVDVRRFIQTTFLETGTPYSVLKPHLGNQKILRLLLALCVSCQTSLEYFLLQDYSEYARMNNGRYYPPAVRQLMSMILRADTVTRNKAIGFVYAATARYALEGKEIPCISTDPATAHGYDVINIMETYNTDDNMKRTKKEFETEIIELLKVRLLNILELSSVPVSSPKLFKVIEGHSRLARRALTLLEQEGKIVRVDTDKRRTYWQFVR